MESRKIKLVIESDFKNVSLVGLIIERLCSLMPLSDIAIEQIHLCLVEAVNNSIEHAYKNQNGHDVEVMVTLNHDKIVLQVCDTGEVMDEACLEDIDMLCEDIDITDIDSIPEEGRGLPIIKEIMDSISYKTENGKNCFTMVKLVELGGNYET